MPFDANLVLIDGTVDLSAVTAASYVAATSTTRVTATGAVVVDLRGTGVRGLAAVLVMPTAGNGTTDYLIGLIEVSDEEDFGNSVYYLQEVVKYDILAVTKGRILGAEAPAIVVRRFTTDKRYVRANFTPAAGNGTGSFGYVQVLLSPYPFNIL